MEKFRVQGDHHSKFFLEGLTIKVDIFKGLKNIFNLLQKLINERKRIMILLI